MPRRASLEIQRKTVNGKTKFWFTVPASMSPTGKRTRPEFDFKKAAELERDRLIAVNRRFGHEAVKLPAEVAADAARAMDVLAGRDVTLTAIAKSYMEQLEKRQRSKTFSEAWSIRMDSLTGRSDSYIRQLRRIGDKLTLPIGDKMLCDIRHDDLRDILSKHYPTPHTFNNALRSLSPLFELAVSERWVDENVCRRIKPRQTGRTEIQILNLNQCRKLLSACSDYRERADIPENLRVDARGALAALCIALFAGVRPGGELERLDWNDVDVDHATVFVSNVKSKTDRSRFFTMPDTLKNWLKTIPETERHGSICPPNWKRIWQVVRLSAGIGDLRDVTRKTFASMHLAHFGDVNLTRSIMGHEQGDVLFQNYRGLVSPIDAKAFWQILPSEKSTNVDNCLQEVARG